MKPLFICTVGILLLNGCSEKPLDPAASKDPELSHLYRNGPMTVALSVSETNIFTSGRVQLILGVQAPEGADVAFPEIERPDSPFLLADSYVDPVQTLPNGKQLHRRTWDLVPAYSGRITLQSFEIQAGSLIIKTDPVAVRVLSLLPQDLNELVIRDIAAPVSLLPEQQRMRQYGLVAGGALFILFLLFLLARFIRRPIPIQVPSPHEAALRALETLPVEPAACVHELNRILKAYLETRHHLPAAGKTASELAPLLESPHFAELAEFLTTAEHIRFSSRVTASFAGEAALLIRSYIENDQQEDACA